MTLPISKETLTWLAHSSIHKWERQEKNVWTNCEVFSVTFMKWGKEYRLIMKKSFLKGPISQYETDYQALKDSLWNQIPTTVFIQGKDGVVFSFSEPVVIMFDVMDRNNYLYLLDILRDDKKFRKQLIFFVKKYRELEKTGVKIDLIWWENLVYTEGGKLKYIDTYIPFHHFKWREQEIESQILYLEECLKITE